GPPGGAAGARPGVAAGYPGGRRGKRQTAGRRCTIMTLTPAHRDLIRWPAEMVVHDLETHPCEQPSMVASVPTASAKPASQTRTASAPRAPLRLVSRSKSSTPTKAFQAALPF